MFSICSPIALIFFGLKFWKLAKSKGFITPGELLGDFYQSRKVQVLVGIIGLLCMIPYATGQLVALGKTFAALTDGVISYEIAISIAVVALGIYLYFGAKAVIWTDMFQGFIFFVLISVAVFTKLN